MTQILNIETLLLNFWPYRDVCRLEREGMTVLDLRYIVYRDNSRGQPLSTGAFGCVIGVFESMFANKVMRHW